jgi:recombination protein RecT
MEKKQLPIWQQQLNSGYTKFVSLNPEKAKNELGFAMQIFQGNQSLQKCSPQSILDAVVNVARTSITLNPVMKLAYLIPRKGKCILEFSYMGLVKMLKDNGCIRTISAHIVYTDEDFEYMIGENLIIHTPIYSETEVEHNARKVRGCYSRAVLPQGDVVFEFMPMWEIDKVKRMSEGSGSKYSAWNTWRDEMIKKSVIKRHFKMLISGNTTEELASVLKIEQDNNKLTTTLDKPQHSIRDAFSDFSVENKDQQAINFEEPSKAVKTTPTELSDDDISMIMDKEEGKVNAMQEMETQKYNAKNSGIVDAEKFTDSLKDNDLPNENYGEQMIIE